MAQRFSQALCVYQHCLQDSRTWHKMQVVKPVYHKNKTKADLTGVSSSHRPFWPQLCGEAWCSWLALRHRAGTVTGKARLTHDCMDISQWEQSCQKSRDIMGWEPGPAFGLCAFPQSPHPVWRQPQQFNLLHTLEMAWPQVICPTRCCSTSSLGGGLPERLLMAGDRPVPAR